MPTLRLLIVEDNLLQARLLQHYVQLLGYHVTGIAATAAEAESMFADLQPDLLLLDIHLRGEVDGIALAQRLLGVRPVPLIFLTSDESRTTFERALTAGPLAFLTKPYDEALLQRTIELAVAHFAREQGGQTAALFDGGALVPGAFYVRDSYRLVKVFYDDVLWLEADNTYVNLHTATHKYTIRISLRELETKLPPNRFVRVRRNALVQLTHIKSVDLRSDFVSVGGAEVPIGGNYRADLLRLLGQLG